MIKDIFDLLSDDINNEFNLYKPAGVNSVGIYGSYSRGEAKENWSDMDVMIFVNNKIIEKELFNTLELINKKLSKKYPSVPLTFRIHSIDEFPEYKQHENSICSYSLFSYYKDMIFIYGADLREEMKNVLKSISISQAINDLRSKILTCRHESRSLITSSNVFQPFIQSFHVEISTNNPEGYKIGKFIDLIHESALCCNILKGCFENKKIDISKNFSRLFPEFRYSNLPLDCSNIRDNGLNNKSIYSELYIKCAEFFEEILDLFDNNLRINQINNAFDGFLVNDTSVKYRKNACAIILDENNAVLVVKKEDDKSWQFIQGGIDDNENLSDAIKREINEETGLKPEKLIFIGLANHKNVYDWPNELQIKRGFRGQEQTFFVIKINDKNEFKLNKDELVDHKWISLQDIPQFVIRSDLLESFKAISKQFPDLLK